jgi:hypothetical protein
MTGHLGRRLDALEQGAEQARRRGIRAFVASLPEAAGLTPSEVDEATALALRDLDDIAGWRADGLADREILERFAATRGLDAGALEADLAQVNARL